MIYQCKLKGIIPSIICWLHSCWCSLVCLQPFSHGPRVACCPRGPTGPFQQSHYPNSSQVAGQSSSGAGPCICLLNFMRPLAAHSSSQEEFSTLYGRKCIRKRSFPNCHWFCSRKCHFWQCATPPPFLSTWVSLARWKALILIFLSCRSSHQAFLMPFRLFMLIKWTIPILFITQAPGTGV